MSPFEHFNNWFDSLIQPHKNDIAFLLTTGLPGFDSDLIEDLDVLVYSFEKHIRYLFEEEKAIGTLISIRGLIDYHFSNQRDSKEYWTAYKQDALYMAEQMQDEELKVEALSSDIRYKQWCFTLNKWYQLKEEHINDIAIKNWKYA